ncbi:MAG TPA: peptidylprolyl isomerase [Thauera sp.]|nr:peptidylprolyl isomerase [Thauera sp.]HRA80913.1 peptidylprolyl isomerase [Thauera sp.]
MRKHLIAFAALATTALNVLAANPMVELKTNQGDIVVEVFADKAPKSAENFVQYVRDGYYNGTVFHRVIDGFMVQGGGFEPGMKQKSTRAPIENEAKNGLKNTAGTLAMARTADPHSASSQFFINLVPNTSLDYPSRDGWGYAVFAKVVKGMDVVEKIAKLPTASRGFHQNVPVDDIIVENAHVLDAAAAKKPGK